MSQGIICLIYAHLYNLYNYKSTSAYKKIKKIVNGIQNFQYFYIIAPFIAEKPHSYGINL